MSSKQQNSPTLLEPWVVVGEPVMAFRSFGSANPEEKYSSRDALGGRAAGVPREPEPISTQSSASSEADALCGPTI
jgi:hypothetical protein